MPTPLESPHLESPHSPVKATDWPGTDSERRAVATAQTVGTYLLRTFDEACQRAGARYLLNGGTLIGALRMQGWIPWDDDVDVVMERPEYERLVASVPTWPVDVALSTPQQGAHATTVPRLNFLPSELTWTERFGIAPPERQHLALDIFLLDVAPRSPRVRAAWLTLTHAQRVLLSIRSTTVGRVRASDETALAKSAACVALGLSHALPRSVQRRAYRATASAFARSEGPLVMLNSSKRSRTVTFEPRVFRDDAVTVIFDGVKALGPDPATFLPPYYGPDFLTAPSYEQRRPQHLHGLSVRTDTVTSHEDPS